MIFRKNHIAAFGAAVGGLMLSSTAMAATETGSVGVSATLTAACSIGDGTLAFGSFASIDAGTAGTVSNAADKDNDTGNISYVCSNGATATLGIAGANDSVAQLRMKDAGTNFLNYDIYSDSARTLLVVPAGGTTPTALALTEDGTNKTIVLYGRVPGTTANQPLGAYSDTLTLTVTYS